MGDVLSFKNYGRSSRTMVVDDDFKSGMLYTNNALDGPFVKTVVNFDYKEDGTALTPRGGFRVLEAIPIVGPLESGVYYPFLTFTTNVTIKTAGSVLKDYRTRCFIIAQAEDNAINLPEYAPERKTVLFPNNSLKMFIQDPMTNAFLPVALDTADAAQSTIDFVSDGYASGQNIHGIPLKPIGAYKPIYSVFNTIGYILFRQRTTSSLHLGKLIIEKNGTTYKYRCEKAEPMLLNPREVVNSGYNMLAKEPYAFTNQNTGIYSIDGLLPYSAPPGDPTRELLLNARPGQSINFELFYQYKTEANVVLRVKWEWADVNGDGTWHTVQTELADNSTILEALVSPDHTAGDKITVNFQPTVNQFQLRASIYRKVGTVIDTSPTKMMVLPLYKLTAENNTTSKNIKPVTYNLATATGMTVWKKRMVLWGATGAESILFTSDINNPGFFPYPNQIELFDENIVHVTSYLDNLLVFTESKIYMLTLTGDGVGFSTQLIQNRLSILPADKHVIQVVKNMIYFKSDNYYYMIVPKANSIKGELLVAPVSKPIINMLDGFENAVREIFDAVYFRELPNEYELSLANYYNYVDNTILRNVYTIEFNEVPGTLYHFEKFHINFVMNYDTVLRTWTTYVYQCNLSMLPFKQTITDTTVLLDVCNRPNGVTAQLVRADTLNPKDEFLLGTGVRTVPNYQYLDTGYRKQGDQHKKRFREVQLKLNNTAAVKLDFYTEFMIDDEPRATYYRYETRHITDPTDPNYGLLYLDRVIEPTLTVAGTTVLAEDDFDAKCWTLDQSKFPPLSVVKIRYAVSGKGYAPRLKFISFNEETYEFLNINWVFRTMNAR